MQRTRTLAGLAMAGTAALSVGMGVGAADARPTIGDSAGAATATTTATYGGPARGIVARDGKDGTTLTVAPDVVQSWVLELPWDSCVATATGNTCADKINAEAQLARNYKGPHPAKVKIRLRAGQNTPRNLPGVDFMQYACPAANNTDSVTVDMPQWWDPDYITAYKQWVTQVNSWVAPNADVVSDVTLSGPMTCFAEPMIRQLDLTVNGETNADRLVRLYKEWLAVPGNSGPDTFNKADLLSWQRAINIHRDQLTAVPTSISMNPFQTVGTTTPTVPVWDPILPVGSSILTYAQTQLGKGRLIEENNSVGVGDIPATCPTTTPASGVPRDSAHVKELYDMMYCRMRGDAALGYMTHYQTETATKIHNDSKSTSVAENTAAVYGVLHDIARLQHGLDAEPPVPMGANNAAHYDVADPCIVHADNLLEGIDEPDPMGCQR